MEIRATTISKLITPKRLENIKHIFRKEPATIIEKDFIYLSLPTACDKVYNLYIITNSTNELLPYTEKIIIKIYDEKSDK